MSTAEPTSINPTAQATRPKPPRERPQDAGRRRQRAHQAANLLKQVSDATRLQIILLLDGRELHVGAICNELELSQPAVSHHLALLRHGGLIAPRRQGKNNFYSLTETGADLAPIVTAMVS